MRLSEISRGVVDPERSAAFYSWLLDMEPAAEQDGLRFNFGGGSLLLHGDPSVPVAIGLAGAGASFHDADPDGVPIAAIPAAAPAPADGSVRVDHVRLNCRDLKATAHFYRSLGFSVTWSGRGELEMDGPQEEPLDGATWMHLSCDNGYLSLSQADWEDYGVHSPASGPPRFVHIGLAVADLAEISERLDGAATGYVRGTPAVGRNLYVNDPDGNADLGTNVEIIEYLPAVQRSGAVGSGA